jgi:CheY-like chemotaxis protein
MPSRPAWQRETGSRARHPGWPEVSSRVGQTPTGRGISSWHGPELCPLHGGCGLTYTSTNVALRLYIVEDSHDLHMRILREVECLAGTQVVGHAAGAGKAIEQIHRIEPDVVVLDLQLSEGGGLDVLREFRGASPSPAIIVLTNHSDAISRELSLRAGARFFFDKSTQFDDFLAALRGLSD